MNISFISKLNYWAYIFIISFYLIYLYLSKDEDLNASIVPDLVTQIVSSIEISTDLTNQDFQNEEGYLLKQKYLNELQLALDWNTQGHLLRVKGDLNGAVNMYQNSIQVIFSSSSASLNVANALLNHTSTYFSTKTLFFVYYECNL